MICGKDKIIFYCSPGKTQKSSRAPFLSKPYFQWIMGRSLGRCLISHGQISTVSNLTQKNHMFGVPKKHLLHLWSLRFQQLFCFNVPNPIISHPRNHHKRVVDTIPKSYRFIFYSIGFTTLEIIWSFCVFYEQLASPKSCMFFSKSNCNFDQFWMGVAPILRQPLLMLIGWSEAKHDLPPQVLQRKRPKRPWQRAAPVATKGVFTGAIWAFQWW